MSAFGALLALALLAGHGCSEPEPVRIGFLGGLSGRVADLGVAGRNGALLAVEKRNAAGGIGGRPVQLVVRDDRQEPEAARQALAELLSERVEAIVGPMTSAMAVAVLPQANEKGLLLVSPTVTTNELTGKDDSLLRVIAPTRDYATKSARHAREQLKRTRVAVAYDLRNKSYAESWYQDFRQSFESDGGTVVAVRTFESSAEVHFSALARELLDARPDLVLLVANSLDTALICQQIRKLDLEIPIAASEWGATERLVELGGSAVEGITIAQFIDRASTKPEYVAFRQDYLQRFGHEPGFAGVAAYDAATVLLEGLARRQGRQSLKDAILTGGTFPGLQDPVKLDRFGDGTRRTFMTTVRNGQFVALGAQ